MSAAEAFNPDWVSPPGDTIKDVMASRNVPFEAFCDFTGLSPASADQLLAGDLPIDRDLAGRLAQTLGISCQFWLNRDENYRRRREASQLTIPGQDFRLFVQRLPLKDMKAYGWLDKYADLPDDAAMLSFFEDTPGAWRQTGLGVMDAVAFRTSFAHETNPAAVAAWLRQGVRQAQAIRCAPWNPDALEAVIPALRALTRVKEPVAFFPQLVDICRACGVAVVFVRTPKGCPASGATHFASPEKAIIQLSFRYRSDDHFWFTVFHEIAHLLLHRESPLFVEGGDYIATAEETEANDYAAQTLIPAAFDGDLQAVARKFAAIMRLAKRIGVSAGIVVGQMQKRGLLNHGQMNFLKTRYDWSEIARIKP